MNVPVKITLASSSVWFADKAFDAMRDHFLPNVFGIEQWIVWAAIAGLASIISACGWWAVHHCVRIFRRTPPTCQISSADGGR
jgi:hypothetical protein